MKENSKLISTEILVFRLCVCVSVVSVCFGTRHTQNPAVITFTSCGMRDLMES